MHKNYFATEIKAEAVRLVTEARMTVKDAADKLGMQVGPIYVWVRRYREERTHRNDLSAIAKVVAKKDMKSSLNHPVSQPGHLEKAPRHRAA